MSTHLGIWSYGAQLSQPLFTGGALKGNLHLAREVRVRQEVTVADLVESVRLSNMRYRGGTTTYLEVLDGQRSLYSAELTLAARRGPRR